MQRLLSWLFAVAAFAAIELFAPVAGHAEIYYPWCAQYGGNFGGENCGFSTYQQCMETVHGIGGFCVRNPFYTAPVAPPAKRARKRHPN